MWLVPRSARFKVVGVELRGSKYNLKNLECTLKVPVSRRFFAV